MKINIGKAINLVILDSSKFKTNLLNVYIQRPLKRDEVTKNALLPYILKSGSSDYPSQKQISNELDNLYGSALYASANKKGEKQILTFKMLTTDEQYLDEEIFENCVKFLNNVIINPYIENDGFKKEYLCIEKENLRDRIKSRINDKGSYALERCSEEMCKDENYSICEYGYEQDLESITECNLYEHYKKVLRESPIDIVIASSLDKEKIISIVKDTFKVQRDEIITIEDEIITTQPKKVKHIVENMDITQGKLVLGYRTNIKYTNDMYYALMVYSSVLGGGPHSKLFVNVREKESLCYYVYSGVDKYKSLLFIPSGIEFENFDKALKLINEQIESIENEDITDDEIINSKMSIINSMKAINDSLNGLCDFCYSQILAGTDETLESMIEKIKKVSKEDIVKVSKEIMLDTVYFLKN